MKFYAHTHPDYPNPEDAEKYWEPLFSEDCGTLKDGKCLQCENLDPDHGHLNKVAYLCNKFAAEMFPAGSEDRKLAAEWGRLAGLWHDLGKFAPEWQEYLKKKSDPHCDDTTGKEDHSTAGAKHSVNADPLFGHLLAYGIAAHHCGLLDTKTNGKSCQESRLNKNIKCFDDAPASLISLRVPEFLELIKKKLKKGDGLSTAFFTRFLFSCLVDADFLATEAFMNPKMTDNRNSIPLDVLKKIDELVVGKINSFGVPTCNDSVNLQRAKVVRDCTDSANETPGIFTLTVPTGGGKTLSSLHFALKHALKYGQKRIIYVVPFTSIIEQNAEVFRTILKPIESNGFTPLIEHHSSLSPDKETEQSRLATENWDAPIVITTAVQFFESLFAAKTSQCRKLHNIANAVVILDEAQSLPVNYISPCLHTLQELANCYNTTVVLCTATQPAIKYDANEFSIGIKNSREIIQNPKALFEALKRVEISCIGQQTDQELSNRIMQCEQALCIVNRRKHAQELFQQLPENSGRFHLSALMCPEHRSQVLKMVRECLSNKQSVKLISTQLIEAGVDVDFPVVYRALAGLDSIAQAAGRCNREGRQSTPGQVYVFDPEDQKAEAYFRETAQVAREVMGLHEDLLSQEAIHHYFDLYYYKQYKKWDEKEILSAFSIDPRLKHCPFRFNFRTAAENFRLIEDWKIPVIIPFDNSVEKLISDLQNEFKPLNRNLLRALQRYTVQVSPRLLRENSKSFEVLRDGQFYVLISMELNYSKEFGLILDEEHSCKQKLIT